MENVNEIKQNKNWLIKYWKLIAFTIGFIILLSGLFTVAFSNGDKSIRLIGMILSFIGMLIIMISFFLDFKNVMVDNETQGDEYTLMSKEKIMKLLDSVDVEYDEDRTKSYYVDLIREYKKEHNKNN